MNDIKPSMNSNHSSTGGGNSGHRLSRRSFLSTSALATGAMPALLSATEPAPGARPVGSALPPSNGSATTYATINRDSWAAILADRGEGYVPPLTVHLPIQPVHSPDFIHVDAALNVCRKRVYPKLSFSPEVHKASQSHETFLVQFALDNPPIVPDMHASRLSLAEEKFPLAHASYFASGLLYEFEYFCRALDERQSLLWIGVTVTNEGDRPRQAHVRAKVNFQIESDVYSFHYAPFYWDATKWLPCDKVQLKDHVICRDSTPIGRAAPGDWKLEWESKSVFDGKAFLKTSYGAPYQVAPCMKLRDVQDAMHFSAPLRPAEEKRFWIALLTDVEGATAEDRQRLMQADPQEDCAAALKHFQSQCTNEHTQLTFPSDNWDSIFAALQLSTLQLCVKFPGEQSLMPTQGGTSERSFVWVWEALFMLAPMLRLGHFEPVRRSLDFIFALQDGGSPPEGELTTTAGAIGTTGFKWLNTTGSALALATDYYLYSRDEKFLAEYLPKMLRALCWIVGELRATRKLNADGSRPLHYGLMPFGCATDGDIGRIVAFTDAFTFLGVEKTVTLLEQTRHERAAEFRRELGMYRTDLARAIEGLTRPDGYIERKILTGNEKKIEPGFERICGAINLALTGALDVRSDRFRRFVAYFEEKLMDGFFTGKMTSDIAYMGIGELAWHHAYLRLGEWKKAFAANRVNLRYGMTQDTFQVQERFSKRNPAFTPWQPNGSGNGRILEMMLNCLYFEHDGRTTLLGGVPWTWLRGNHVTRLAGLYTQRGRLDLEATMVDAQHCQLVLSAAAPGVLPMKLRLPDHFEIRKADPVPARKTKQELELKGQPKRLVLLLREIVC